MEHISYLGLVFIQDEYGKSKIGIKHNSNVKED
jgi:hypothetical protein